MSAYRRARSALQRLPRRGCAALSAVQGCSGRAATTLANERCTGHTYFGAARGPEPKQLRLSCSAAMAMDEPVGPLEPSAEMEAMMKKMNYGLIKVRSCFVDRLPPVCSCAAGLPAPFHLLRHLAATSGR